MLLLPSSFLVRRCSARKGNTDCIAILDKTFNLLKTLILKEEQNGSQEVQSA